MTDHAALLSLFADFIEFHVDDDGDLAWRPRKELSAAGILDIFAVEREIRAYLQYCHRDWGDAVLA